MELYNSRSLKVLVVKDLAIYLLRKKLFATCKCQNSLYLVKVIYGPALKMMAENMTDIWNFVDK